MLDFRFGDIRITRIVELEQPLLEARSFLLDWDEDAAALHEDRMVPRHYRPESGLLVLAIQSFLVRTPRHTILVDSCVGNNKPRNRPIFDRAAFPWMDRFVAAGIRPEDVDFVLCTHLHVDHVGWNTRLVDGRWIPTFPNAKYIFARAELDFWLEQSAERRMTRTGDYIVDSVVPILSAKQELLVEMDHQIEDGIVLEPLPGHTPGQVGLRISGGGDRAVLCGDLMHHMFQCRFPDWSTLACADPAAARRTRRAFLERHADGPVMVLPSHFPGPTAGYVVSKGGAYDFRYVGE